MLRFNTAYHVVFITTCCCVYITPCGYKMQYPISKDYKMLFSCRKNKDHDIMNNM